MIYYLKDFHLSLTSTSVKEISPCNSSKNKISMISFGKKVFKEVVI